MRRADHQNKALHRRLAGFTKAYKEAANRYLESLKPEMVSSESGYWFVDEEEEILDLVPEVWDDVKKLLHTYPLGSVVGPYKDKALRPLTDEVQKKLKAWWKKTWRRDHVIFRGIPPAPKLDMTSQKINQREYLVGQLRLVFEGSKIYRQCIVHVAKSPIYRIDIPPVDLRQLPDYITTHLMPEIKRVSALCDWTQFSQLSPAQQEAIWYRLNVIIHYYHQEHPGIGEKINRKAFLPLKYNKIEL